mgnify:FL=1
MTTTLRIVLIGIAIIYLWLIIIAVRKRKMQASIATFWILTGILLIIAVVIPNFIETISNILGFEQTSNMVFCLTIFMAFCALLYLTMLVSKQSKKCITLIQEISILKKKVEELEKNIN